MKRHKYRLKKMDNVVVNRLKEYAKKYQNALNCYKNNAKAKQKY